MTDAAPYKPDDIMRMFGVDNSEPSTRPYGNIDLTEHYDKNGACIQVTVGHADDRIGITKQLLDQIEPGHIDNDGNLVVDTAGEYVYRPVRFAEQGRVVVCERVR